MNSRQWVVAAAIALSPVVSFAQSSKAVPAAAAQVAAELAALVKSAQAEGEMTYYTSAPDNVAKRVNEGFLAKYGIQAKFIRLSSAPLVQRYSTEAEAGNFPAGVVFIAGSGKQFGDQGVKNGWLEPVAQAGLPVVRSGEFPARFLTGPTAIVQVTPLVLAYNTDKVKGADIPREWTDLLNPKWKGQFLLPDPKSSDVYYDFWTMLYDKYGESFFTQLRANGLRQVGGGGAIAAIQALGAGEGSITAPTTVAITGTVKGKGGPVETVTPDFTTGIDLHIMLTARAKSKQAAASRLFVNYVMSSEGNRLVNADPGNNSVYDNAILPKQYQMPNPGAVARKDQVLKILGVQ